MKCIALVEWNWVGHHPTFFAHYVLALEELGIKVLAICPSPENALQEVSRLRKVLLKTDLLSHSQYHGFDKPTGKHTLPRFPGAMQRAIRHFCSIEQTIKNWQRESGSVVESIFYSCIYDCDFERHFTARPFLTLPWRGLYLHAASFRRPGEPLPLTGRVPRPDRIFRGNLFKGVGILDEGIVDQLETMVKKPVVVFPDLTDETMPTTNQERILADRLKAFAQGRPIVCLFGHLQNSKGLLPLLRASQHEKLSHICFAFGGDIIWHTFTKQEAQSIQHILATAPNVWSHMVRIPAEPCLNLLISACDILCAAYVDFPHSSGMLAKAAFLKKPLIVSDGYLMAERVRRYNMGEVVPQGDINALIEAILKFTKKPADWITIKKPFWSDYCQEHSFEHLKESFRMLFARS